eukprot:gene5114-6365_t
MKSSKLFIIVLLTLALFKVNGDVQCLSTIGNKEFFIEKDLCVWEYSSGLKEPRQLYVASNGDVLVEQNGVISALWDDNKNGFSEDNEKVSLTPTGLDLNHAVIVNQGYLYASSETAVYRWPYKAGDRKLLGDGQKLVNLPSGGHVSRTLIFDSSNVLYISVGSLTNIDLNSTRARVVKCSGFDFDNVPNGGYDWTNCEVWADGTRNEVGLAFDSKGRLWGVENGADDVNRPEWGGDYHNTNPCEEINLLDKKGFYGYPYCFSEGYLPAPIAKGNGTQWATQNLGKTDEWCRDTNNVIVPAFCMEAHTAPLDIIFHESNTFPDPFKSGMIIAQHGSWNRQPPSGYQVVHVELDSNGMPKNGTLKKLFGVAQDGNKWTVRPVSVAKLSPCGPRKECILVSSDSDGKIYAISTPSFASHLISPLKCNKKRELMEINPNNSNEDAHQNLNSIGNHTEYPLKLFNKDSNDNNNNESESTITTIELYGDNDQRYQTTPIEFSAPIIDTSLISNYFKYYQIPKSTIDSIQPSEEQEDQKLEEQQQTIILNHENLTSIVFKDIFNDRELQDHFDEFLEKRYSESISKILENNYYNFQGINPYKDLFNHISNQNVMLSKIESLSLAFIDNQYLQLDDGHSFIKDQLTSYCDLSDKSQYSNYIQYKLNENNNSNNNQDEVNNNNEKKGWSLLTLLSELSSATTESPSLLSNSNNNINFTTESIQKFLSSINKDNNIESVLEDIGLENLANNQSQQQSSFFQKQPYGSRNYDHQSREREYQPRNHQNHYHPYQRNQQHQNYNNNNRHHNNNNSNRQNYQQQNNYYNNNQQRDYSQNDRY